jgi:plastocyanin
MRGAGRWVLVFSVGGVLAAAGCGAGGGGDAGDFDAAVALDGRHADSTAGADAATPDHAVADGAGANDAASGTDAAACVATTAVTVRNFRFDPECITVSAGATVTWTNAGMATHTVTSDTGAPVSFDSGALGLNGVFTFQFDSPSTVHYHCIPHQASGMVGTVIVE